MTAGRILMLLALLGMAGCSPGGDRAVDLAPPEVDIVWPAPPEDARIRFLYAFDEPSDLGTRTSIFSRLWELIAGGKSRSLVRPYAIAADGPLLVVTDPGSGAVHIFDREKRSYERVTAAGNERLRSPVGVAIGNDRIYVSDSALGIVFIFDRDGGLVGKMDGFQRPTGLARDRQSGRLFVADTLAHSILAYDSEGRELFRFGSRGSGEGEFNYPTHLAIAGGHLVVNDNMNFRIQLFDLDGKRQSGFGTHGDSSGQFSQPKGVAVDSEGHIYVAEAMVNRVQIFDRDGRFLLAFGGQGANVGSFVMPAGIAIVEDKIYVADSYNSRVQVFEFLGGGG